MCHDLPGEGLNEKSPSNNRLKTGAYDGVDSYES
jgi:hypothetical protein